jgi:hypothetical protein
MSTEGQKKEFECQILSALASFNIPEALLRALLRRSHEIGFIEGSASQRKMMRLTLGLEERT